MSDWCLIESDPGVFTELIRGFGVSGIQVEELYSIDEESFSALKPVHGLIFLFKWVGNSEIDGSFVNDDKIVFIKQVVTNACATQAILSLLMNLKHDDIDLGAHLTDFKSFIAEMDPEMRGMVMGSSDLIRTVHNSFTRQQLWELDDKRPQKDEDAFHFVAYLPINGRLYELDGLREAPIDLGPIEPGTEWTQTVKPVLEKRMMKYSEGEIHFNLMALVSDRKKILQREVTELKAVPTTNDSMQLNEIRLRIVELEREIENEDRKMLTYKKENIRRKHNYLPLIVEMLKAMAEKGLLVNAVEKSVKKAEQRIQMRRSNKK